MLLIIATSSTFAGTSISSSVCCWLSDDFFGRGLEILAFVFLGEALEGFCLRDGVRAATEAGTSTGEFVLND